MDVKEVQRSLWEQSKKHKANRESSRPLFPTDPYEGRIRQLMDLMHNPTWLREAALRTLERSKGKAAGIDKMTVSQFENNFEKHLEALRMELKRGIYQPKPVRRVCIPKANGKMRALGIPCLRDKIVQEAIRMALEPIFEVEFHDNSYGFRPNRNTHHAVFRCQQLMRNKFTWVIEGDVKACFDEISHKSILKVVREKVMDNKFLDLIDRFLKAGVSIDKVIHPTEKGVPQGGVISPLLANAVLNKLDWFLQSKGVYGINTESRNRKAHESNSRFVRYADDWCVFLTRSNRRQAETFRREIAEFLRSECGLELSAEKTHITHVRDGFDFLGFRLSCGLGRKGKVVPKIKVGQKAIQNFKEKIDRETRYVAQQRSIASRIFRATLVVRGWAEYYRIAHNFKAVANRLDYYAFWSMVKGICRKLDISTAKCMKRFLGKGTLHYGNEVYLDRLSSKDLKFDYHGPEPYIPGEILIREEEEEEKLELCPTTQERRRKGSMDLKITQLQQDNYCCKKCGKKVAMNNSDLDHIVPVKNFPTYEASNLTDNLQTLCRSCHKEKIASERRKG